MWLKKFCVTISICFLQFFSSAQSWYPASLPTDSSNLGAVFALHSFNNELYVGGDFWFDINGVKTYMIAKWNGTNWDSLQNGIDLSFGISVKSINNFNNKLYVGGQFKYAGHVFAPTIAAWDGVNWSLVNSYYSLSEINTIQEYNGKLYVGGSFYTLQNDSSYVNVDCCIATWDGAVWDSVSSGSLDGVAKTMIIYKDDLYVGGGFYTAGGTPVYNVARYDGNQWQPLGQGTAGQSGYVLSFENDTVNDLLYVGGQFEYVIKNDSTQLETSGLGIWDGTEWSVPSEKLPANYYAGNLKIYHGLLYTGGSPTGLATWNGKNWIYYSGIDPFYGLTACSEIYNDTLFEGGYFSEIIQNGDTFSAPGLARWWSPNYCDSAHAIINTVSDTVSFQAGDSIQIASAGFSNQWEWDFGDGTQDTAEKPVHIYDSAGNFTLKLRATYGLCPWDNDSVTIAVNPVGINENSIKKNEIKIYPNPTENRFTVEIQHGNLMLKNAKLEIVDVRGKMMKQLPVNNRQLTIETNGWERGVYFVNLISGGKAMAKGKVLVE